MSIKVQRILDYLDIQYKQYSTNIEYKTMIWPYLGLVSWNFKSHITLKLSANLFRTDKKEETKFAGLFLMCLAGNFSPNQTYLK